MQHVPTGSILLIVLLDIAVVCGLSAIFGAGIARAAGSRPWLGVLVGLLLPVVGPLAWLLVGVVRDHRLLATERNTDRCAATWVPFGLVIAGALAFVVATPLAWGSVRGGYDGYSLATDASPADSVVGAAATVGSAVLLAVVAYVLVISTARRRLAVPLGFVAGTWLLVTLDSLVVIFALDGFAEDVSGVSRGQASVEAAPAGGLWTCLLAAVLTLAAALVLMIELRGTRPPTTNVSQRTSGAPPPSWIDATGWQPRLPEPSAAPPSEAGGGWGTPASQWGDDDRGRTSW